jgi:hypothetical protein
LANSKRLERSTPKAFGVGPTARMAAPHKEVGRAGFEPAKA